MNLFTFSQDKSQRKVIIVAKIKNNYFPSVKGRYVKGTPVKDDTL